MSENVRKLGDAPCVYFSVLTLQKYIMSQEAVANRNLTAIAPGLADLNH